MLTNFVNFVGNQAGVKKNNFVDENQSCSPFNSVQDALSIKFWGPSFFRFRGHVNFHDFGVLGGPSTTTDIWIFPSPHAITPRKETRREAGILT